MSNRLSEVAVTVLEGAAKFLGRGGAPAVATLLAIGYGEDSLARRLGIFALTLLGAALLWWVFLAIASSIRGGKTRVPDAVQPLPPSGER
jgi:hypothetical protein